MDAVRGLGRHSATGRESRSDESARRRRHNWLHVTAAVVEASWAGRASVVAQRDAVSDERKSPTDGQTDVSRSVGVTSGRDMHRTTSRRMCLLFQPCLLAHVIVAIRSTGLSKTHARLCKS